MKGRNPDESLGALSVWGAGDVCGRVPTSSIKHQASRDMCLVTLSLFCPPHSKLLAAARLHGAPSLGAHALVKAGRLRLFSCERPGGLCRLILCTQWQRCGCSGRAMFRIRTQIRMSSLRRNPDPMECSKHNTWRGGARSAQERSWAV